MTVFWVNCKTWLVHCPVFATVQKRTLALLYTRYHTKTAMFICCTGWPAIHSRGIPEGHRLHLRQPLSSSLPVWFWNSSYSYQRWKNHGWTQIVQPLRTLADRFLDRFWPILIVFDQFDLFMPIFDNNLFTVLDNMFTVFDQSPRGPFVARIATLPRRL